MTYLARPHHSSYYEQLLQMLLPSQSKIQNQFQVWNLGQNYSDGYECLQKKGLSGRKRQPGSYLINNFRYRTLWICLHIITAAGIKLVNRFLKKTSVRRIFIWSAISYFCTSKPVVLFTKDSICICNRKHFVDAVHAGKYVG